MQEKIEIVSLELITANPHQPRKEFDEDSLLELVSSIKMHGILQPPIVQKKFGGSQFELIAGERRVRAAKLAGLLSIPVIIRDIPENKKAEAALIENIQRVDLHPLEVATAIRKLMLEFGITQEEVSLRVGKKRSTIANFLRLLSLPDEIQKGLNLNEISMGHAKVILSIDGRSAQLAFYRLIREKDLSVKAAENAIQSTVSRTKTKPQRPSLRNEQTQEVIDQLQHQFGTKVQIAASGKDAGQIRISYYNLNDLNRLLDIFLEKHELR